jgi:hypothetical protein
MFLLLSGSTLSFWLKDNQFDNISIGLFSLANILHVFKFLWGPYLENMSLVKQHKNGFKTCLLVSLFGCVICIFLLSTLSPIDDIHFFCCTLVVLSFFSSSFEMLVQASQILLVEVKSLGVSEAFCITGYRIGILLSGSFALYISEFLSWPAVYQIMGTLCLIILLISAFYPFTDLSKNGTIYIAPSYIAPFKDFLQKNNLIVLILFLITFRLQDHILGKMPNMFLLEVGYSKTVIAIAYKAFGLFTSVLGGFAGGYLCRTYSYKYIFPRVLIIYSLAGLLFLLFSFSGAHIGALYFVVLIHEFCKGLTITPFFSYQLRCCNPIFSITHIAIITSIVEFSRIAFGSVSGFLSTELGWQTFFIISSLSSIICLPLIRYIPEGNSLSSKKTNIKE